MKKKNFSKITKYHFLIDKLILNIENILDQYNGKNNIDYEINNGVIKIIFENKHQILITRQETIQQLWLANHKIGYHFEYKNKKWKCTKTKKTFNKIFKNLLYKATKEKYFNKFIF
ncbi:iron donor protein CyaY [Buchnera aphidicola]|uniref:iron donor protein CyaY n=1 Tax=Buchnera aphidicola TaxID=9 RepID=UPI0031B899F9